MKARVFAMIAVTFTSVFGCGPDLHAAANSGTIYAGTARADITPAEGTAVDLVGQKLRIVDRLFARVVVLREGDVSLAIVALDQILFASEKVVAQAKKKWGVGHVLLCSSHTHAGMAPKGVILTPRASGGSRRDWTRAWDDPGYVLDWNTLDEDPWFAATEERIVAAIGEAMQNLFPARVSAGTERFENDYMAHNRRRVNANGTVTMMWANPGRAPTEPIDPTVRVIRVDDSSRRPRALLVHYACHPVMYMNSGMLSRDFPGVMVDHVEAKVGKKCMAVFLQGAAGDLDPYDLHTKGNRRDELVRKAGVSLAEAAIQLAGKLRPGPKTGASLRIKESLLEIPHRRNKDKTSKVGVMTAVINDDIAFTAVPGEPFIQFQLDLAENSPVQNTLMLGYTHCGRGSPFVVYIPTEQAVKEGGYGATECSFLAADAGARMLAEGLSSIKELLKTKKPDPAVEKAAEQPTPDSPETEDARILDLAKEMKTRGLGDWNVRNVLERVLREYPDTEAASQAREMLEKMK